MASPLPTPDPDQLAALDQHFRFGLSPHELAQFAPAVASALTAASAVERLHQRIAPPTPPRSWTPPAPHRNRLGAWQVRTSITESPRGPLAGRTIAIKDSVSVAGLPMMIGSRLVEGFGARRDATAVRRLLEAGATIAGTAVCEDLCLSGSSFTSRPAPVRNPWEPTRSAGGSSSGCAALVATADVDLALGGDQGGSIRVPAAFCGIVGHKPTHGLIPYTGAFPLEMALDHLGPMTRSVADAATMLAVLAGRDGIDPRQLGVLEPVDYLAALAEPTSGLRIGIVAEGFGTPVSDPAVDAAVHGAIRLLCDAAGLKSEDVSIPWHLNAPAVWSVLMSEAARRMLQGDAYSLDPDGFYDPDLITHLARRRIEHSRELSATVKLAGLSGQYLRHLDAGRHYAMARQLVPAVGAAYDQALIEHDVLVMPTVPHTPTPIPSADAPLAEQLGMALSMIGNVVPFNVSGHPACSVPVGLVDGLPTGLMIVGRHGQDATVLRVAHAYEMATGGFPTVAAQLDNSQCRR